MKKVSQIVSVFLTAYFIMLPMLFGLHALQHDHENSVTDHFELVFSEDVPECDLCDLFFSNTAILESSAVTITPCFDSFDQSLFSKALTETTLHLNFLRGPPAV